LLCFFASGTDRLPKRQTARRGTVIPLDCDIDLGAQLVPVPDSK
jgi:hypothetical protein